MAPVDKEKLVILQPELENNPVSKLAPTNKVISVPNEICNNILDAIGSTPMVRLNKVASELQCEIVVKCEFFNAGGSVKDRIGKRMVNDAEAQGKISPGDTLIEPTSGNTGIGLALASAVKNYRCIIVLPEKMSKEKVDVLKALGAEIIRTPTEAAYDAPDSHISVAKRLQTEIDNSYILDQYKNPSNPAAHYDDTAEEIWRQCDGKVDMIVCGAGTGGTISGIAKKLKEYNPNVIVVGVDPFGSILAQPDNLNEGHPIQPYQVEGIGYDFIPDVLDRTLIDRWYKSNDKDSLVMMRRLIRDEGLLCGGSSGSAVSIALHAAKCLKKGQRCVVMLPDSVRNYMTKALSDDWMVDHGFVDNDVIKQKRYDTCWWAEKHVSDIVMTTPLTITEDVTCREAILLLKEEGFDMVPVLNKDNEIVGVVTEGNMSSMILQGRIDKDASISEARSVMYKNFAKVKMNDKLSELAKWFDHEPFALVITEQRCYGYKRQQLKTTKGEETTNKHEREVVTKSVISGIVTRIDLLDFISQG